MKPNKPSCNQGNPIINRRAGPPEAPLTFGGAPSDEENTIFGFQHNQNQLLKSVIQPNKPSHLNNHGNPKSRIVGIAGTMYAYKHTHVSLVNNRASPTIRLHTGTAVGTYVSLLTAQIELRRVSKIELFWGLSWSWIDRVLACLRYRLFWILVFFSWGHSSTTLYSTSARTYPITSSGVIILDSKSAPICPITQLRLHTHNSTCNIYYAYKQ